MRRLLSSVLASLVTALSTLPGAASAAPGDISLVSVRLPGQTTSMYGSYGARISANGQFLAFFSSSPDLVAQFTNANTNLFVHNLQTGTIDAVRVTASGSPFSASDTVSISADGRYLAFTTSVSSVVAGDTNGVGDVFVRDRQSGATAMVSLSSSGAQGAQVSYAPDISADGRYVAFASRAANLVPGDTNKADDVFVRDRQTGRTERMSISTAGVQGNGPSFAPAISPDGRYVAFASNATNLATGDTNAVADIFVHDRQTGATARVSLAAGGAQANGGSARPAISSDGRFVAFSSDGSNLVPGDTNGATDIFVRDRQAGATERASVNSLGQQANGPSVPSYATYWASISADGRYVAFSSSATNLVPNDTNGAGDVFVHDRLSGQTLLASLSTAGVQASAASTGGSLSADGRYVAFDSYAANLVAGDRNGTVDVFVRDRQASTLIVASANKVKSTAAGNMDSIYSSGCYENAGGPSISADGRYVAFMSTAPDLVAGQPLLPTRKEDTFPHAFVRDRQTGKTASVGSVLTFDARLTATHVAISADASTLAIWGGDCSNSAIVDRVTGVVDPDASIGSGAAWSSDGRFVAMGFVAGGGVFLGVLDRRTRQTDNVCVSSAGLQANSDCESPAMSADGRYVAFLSAATNLVAGDRNGTWDVFVRDRLARTTERVSTDSGGREANHGSAVQYAWQAVSISADGRYVAFESDSTNLVPDDLNGFSDVFVKDRQTGQIMRVSENSNGVGTNANSSQPMLSPDGHFVVFYSTATNLVPNYQGKFFIHDRLTGLTEGLLTDPKTQNAISPYTYPSLSADQRLVAFATNDSLVKTDLNQSAIAEGFGVQPDASLAQDIYIQERAVSTSVLAVSPKALAFGNQAIKTSSAARPVTVTNTGATAVPITSIALKGANPGQFSFTHNCGVSLAANASCTVRVVFKPTTRGAKSATLNVNGGGGGLRTVKLTGTGT
jgi:Tol biopolymer transport system component